MAAKRTASELRCPTRERILNEAERLIAVRGVFGFTLRDVAAPLGVKVPAIYKHFESRDDMLIEVSRRFIALLAEQFQAGPGADAEVALRHSLDDLVRFKMLNPAYVRLALTYFATPAGGMEYVKRARGRARADRTRGRAGGADRSGALLVAQRLDRI